MKSQGMTRLLKGSCSILLALALIGCATKMSPEERLALKRVSIGSIELPEKPFVPPAGTGAAFFLAGPLGVALANGSTDLPTAFKDHLAKNNIDVAAYIRSELISQLKSKGIEVVNSENRGNPVLVVQVLQYGLTGGLMSDDRLPQLWLRLSLRKESGELMWLGFAAAHSTQGITEIVPPRPIPDFFNDPKLLERDFRKVTNVIVSSAMKDL